MNSIPILGRIGAAAWWQESGRSLRDGWLSIVSLIDDFNRFLCLLTGVCGWTSAGGLQLRVARRVATPLAADGRHLAG